MIRLRTKLFLSYMGLVTLAVVGVGAMTVVTERDALKREIHQNQQQLVRRLVKVCEESLLENELVFFNYTRALRTERGFREAGFADMSGVIRFDTTPTRIGGSFLSPAENKIADISDSFEQHYNLDGARSLDIAEPVLLAGRRVGTARLLIDQDEVDQFLSASSVHHVRRIGAIALGVLLVSFFVAWLLARATVRPIEQMVAGMRDVSAGRRHPIAFTPRRDELGWMGDELNHTILKLKEVDEMKEDFVAGVTHDLKSPLKAIQAFVTRLFTNVGKYGEDRQRDYLLIIQNNADRLLELIDDVLTTARLEAGREELDLKRFDLRDAVSEVARLFGPLAQEKNLELKVEMPSAPANAKADRAGMTHVLNNLVSNAIKFTRSGSVTVRLRSDASGTHIEVADTGVGIPAEDREKIFGKFFRSRANAAEAKGTGLGLSIVKGLIEAHGGTIRADSNRPHGTVVRFFIPV